MDAGEASLGGLGERPRERLRVVRLVGLGNGVHHEFLCRVDEDARRPPLVVPDHGAALGRRGRGRVRVDAGGAERGRVRPGGVPVDAAEPDGPVGERGVEVLTRREGAVAAPVVLVPPAAHDPRALRHVLGEGHQPLDDLGRRGGPHEVGLEERLAEAHEVGVRVDQAGDDRPPAEVEAGPVGIGPDHVLLGADGDEPAVLDGERLGHRRVLVDGVDEGVDGDVTVLGDGERGNEEKGEEEGSEHSGRSGGGPQGAVDERRAPPEAAKVGGKSGRPLSPPARARPTA